MADQRITQLAPLSKAGVSATDVLPIADISAGETKKVTAKDLVAAGIDLVDNSEIDLAKLDQASVTKLGTTAFADDAVTYAKIQNVSATDRLLGRSTAGAGNVEEITCTAAGRALLDDADAAAQRTTLGLGTLSTQNGTYSGTHSGTSSGTNTGDQTITLTGDVTGSGTGSFAATIANDAVTYAKIQNTSTTNVVLGRSSAGGGDVEEIVCTAAGRALLDDADAATQRTTLGLGTIATQNASAVAITGGTATVSSLTTSSATITGGSITGITDLAVADGGTGASTASLARQNLGLEIGTDVQAYDPALQSIAGLTTAANQLPYTTGVDTYAVTALTAAGRALLDDATAADQRTTLGLGTVALVSSVTATELANDAVTADKLANESTVDLVTTLPGSGNFTGQFALVTSTNKLYCWDGAAWNQVKAAGSVNTISADNSNVIDLTITASGDTVTIAAAPENTGSANQFLAGPTNAGGAVTYRVISSTDLPTATTSTQGAVQVNGEGLRMDASVIEVDNDVTASPTDARVVTYNNKGLITGGRAIQATDLPAATVSTNGAVQPGTGLSVTAGGVLNHTNTVVGTTATKVTFDNQGHITSSSPLLDTDIPNISAAKLTTGTLDASRLAANTITGAKLADSSVVQFGGAGNNSGMVIFPTAAYKGQYFYDESNQDLYLWNGNAWLPVTITAGELIYSGVYSAATNTVTSVTSAGFAAGFVVGAALPAAAASNARHYVIVGESGTGVTPAPTVALAPPDFLVSSGTSYDLVDISSGIGSQLASNVTFTPYGNIVSNNVQSALQELDDEKLQRAGGTMTGELLIGTAGSLVFEGATADAFETTLAVTDPTVDRTITLPNQSGNVLVSGNASIVNADISATAEVAVSKLANGTARQLLQTAAGGTDVEWASNIDIPGTLDVTGTATFDGTVNISDGTY